MNITLTQWENEEQALIEELRSQGIVNSDAQAIAEARLMLKYNTTWSNLFKEKN